MNGILNVLKPPGMTSHDVVSYIRKVTKIKRIGHTGTLDPGATGVLPICIGKSTKIVDFIMKDKKVYICELTLGNKTDTYDKYGSFINNSWSNLEDFDINTFESLINDFKGEIMQRPPAYSAIKVNGRRAYDLARMGESIELPERKITIFDIRVIKYALPKILMEIKCSKGTYIRSICSDIGDKLGYGGYMSFLIRTSTGKFNLSNSYILDEINNDNIENILVPSDYALDFKNIYVDESLSNKVLNGNSILIENNNLYDNNEMVKIYLKPDRFIGIGIVSKGVLQIEKVLV